MLGLAAGDDQVGPQASEGKGDFPAYSAAAAGHQSGAVFEQIGGERG